MKNKRILSGLLAFAICIQATYTSNISFALESSLNLNDFVNTETYNLDFTDMSTFSSSWSINGTTIPIAGYENLSASYGYQQCWAFSQMVYQKIWGTSFTSYRGTSDDMLRQVADGSSRAITATNAKNFLSVAPAGAVVRIQSSNLDGSDTGASYLHSLILVDSDENGCWIYESCSNAIYLRYFTWSTFATKFASYGYFKYIKWPGAEAYTGTAVKPTNVKFSTDKSSYPLSDTVTFTSTGTNASYFDLTITNSSGSTVHSNSGFSQNATWKPTTAGTYTAYTAAYNGTYSTKSSSVTFNVYDAAPEKSPTIEISASKPTVGQTIKFNWDAIINTNTYTLEIKKSGTTVYKSVENDCTYSTTLPSGSYTATVTASNPYGDKSSQISFTVSDTTYSGTMGDTVTWSLNTSTGVFAMSGTGEAVNNYWTSPWYEYRSYVKSVDIADGITHIPFGCFSGFTNVTEYDIPDSVVSIGSYAFSNNKNLTTFTISQNISALGNKLFYYCDNLTTVHYYPTSTSILKSATNIFEGCDNKVAVIFYSGSGAMSSDYTTYMAITEFAVYIDANGGVFENVGTGNKWDIRISDSILKNFLSLKLDGNSETYDTYSIDSFPAPTRDGFTFDGWYTLPEGGTKITESTTIISIAYSSHTLYAQWTPNTYDVEFITGEGVSEQSSTTAEYWSTYEDLPEATLDSKVTFINGGSIDNNVRSGLSTIRDYSVNSIGEVVQTSGYEFDGWYTAEYGGVKITEDSIVELDKTQQIYAQWIDRNVRIENASLSKSDNKLVYSVNTTADNLVANALIKYYDSNSKYLGVDIITIDLIEQNGILSLNNNINYSYCTLTLCDDDLVEYGEIAYVYEYIDSEISYYNLTGAVKSYNPTNTTKLELYQDNIIKYSTTISAENGNGQVTQDFAFSNVEAGTYSLLVTKNSHTSYEISNIVVNEDLDLTTNSNSQINLISLLCGDINGDNEINQNDLNILWLPSNYNKTLSNANSITCDLNGDGEINQNDLNILWLPINYNKGKVTINW